MRATNERDGDRRRDERPTPGAMICVNGSRWGEHPRAVTITEKRDQREDEPHDGRESGHCTPIACCRNNPSDGLGTRNYALNETPAWKSDDTTKQEIRQLSGA